MSFSFTLTLKMLMYALIPPKKIVLPFVVICLGLMLTGCLTAREKVKKKSEIAKHYNMYPFAPSGGYQLGSIIALVDGFPELSAGVEWLEKRGKYKPLNGPIDLPPSVFNESKTFKADLDAKLDVGKINSAYKSELSKIRSFELEIKAAKRNYLSEGKAGLLSWLYSLNLEDDSDYNTLRVIHDTHDGQQTHIIYEVIEVFDATYTAEWDNDLSAEAKAEFLKLFDAQGTAEWLSEGKVEVKISPETPILVTYKSYDLPMDAIKKGLSTRSWQ